MQIKINDVICEKKYINADIVISQMLLVFITLRCKTQFSEYCRKNLKISKQCDLLETWQNIERLESRKMKVCAT